MSKHGVGSQVMVRGIMAPYVNIVSTERTWRGTRYVGTYRWADIGLETYVFYAWRIRGVICHVEAES